MQIDLTEVKIFQKSFFLGGGLLFSETPCTLCPDKKGATDFFTITFTNMHGFFMIFGTQLCKWILIILVNLLHCVTCTSLTWWRNVDVTEIMPLTMHVTLSHCHHAAERDARFYPSRDVATQFASTVDYSTWAILQESVYCSRIHDVKELKDRLLREWRLLDHTIIAASAIAQWCSRLNACVCVNGGHFERQLWACFVCFIDTGFHKCDRYKHVHIVWNVLLLCLTLSHVT